MKKNLLLCFLVTISLFVFGQVGVTKDISIQACYNLNGVFSDNLNNYKTQIVSNDSDLDNRYKFSYYSSYNDAENEISPQDSLLSLLASDPFNSNQATYNVYVRIDTKDDSGFAISTIGYQFIEKVPLKKYEVIVEKEDGLIVIDLMSYLSYVIDNPELGVFTFYNSLDDSLNQINPIANPSSYTSILSDEIVYVRVEKDGYCDNLIKIIIRARSYPIDYYDGATGTGYNLKTQLYSIVNNHIPISYTPGLWDLYKTGDAFKDNWYENDGTLLDIYSENADGIDPYTYQVGVDQCGNVGAEGKCYNREHLIPQSIFNKKSPMVSDAFHIWPTDGKVNGMRDNYPFGKVDKATWTSLNGSKLGLSASSTGYVGTVFEPVDEFKGDIARAYFYFATRYENTIDATWKDYPMFNKFDKNQFFTEAFKNILLTWNAMDPVSDREIAINKAIYAKQKNRNPYIDHPEWISTIWGESLNTDDFEYQPRDFIEVYPTLSTNGIVYIKLKEDKSNIKKVSLFNMNGILIQSINNYDGLSELKIQINTSGIYIIKILGNNFEVNRKVIVK